MAEGRLPEEWWINPLPLPSGTNLSNSNSNASANDSMLLQAIDAATTSALDKANQLMEEYVSTILE